MTPVDQFLSHLMKQNVSIWIKDDNLHYSAPKGAMTPELLARIKRRKQEIMAFIRRPATTEIEPIPQRGRHELSHAQRRLWILDKMVGGGMAYNIPGALALKGKLNFNAVERGFHDLFKRHESLRTIFSTVAGEPVQKILDVETFLSDRDIVARVDLTDETDPGKRAGELARQDAKRPFDLEKGPLVRISLLKLDADEHVLLFNMHHIISDGWSINVLIREFCKLYEHFTSRLSSPSSHLPYPLAPLRIQYKDYAAWQNKLLSEETISIHRDYWHKKLSDEIAALDLPADFPRPPVQTFNGSSERFRISTSKLEKLAAFSVERAASLFMSLLAMVKVLLYRYTGQEDIIVGSPNLGRSHADLEEQIGFFVNTMALRDRLSGEMSFNELLKQVKQTATEAYDHQVYPFDRLVEELDLRRDLSRSPLFDVMAVLQNDEDARLSLEGLRVYSFEQEYLISKFDLTFNFIEEQEGLDVIIEYSTDLFHRARIERMGAHFSELWDSILENPDLPVDCLNILPKAEHHQLLCQFNETASDYPSNRTIPDLFEEQVEKTPDHIAVVFKDRTLTYKELNERANALARLLLEEHHVQPEAFVGVLMDRSEWVPAVLLAILKAGAAYMPIDPAYPRQRVEFILNDSSCRLVISDESHGADLSDFTGVEMIEATAAGVGPASNPGRRGDGGCLAYVIYTSGSTGRPKGSLIEHRSVARLALNTNYTPLDESVRILQTGSLAFDASTFEIWGALLNGGSLCLPPELAMLDAREIGRMIRRFGVTTMFLTTSLFNRLVEEDVSVFQGLDHLLMGGERVSPRHVNMTIRAHPNLTFKHVYGPTESTTFTTCFHVESEFESNIPIGAPISNTTVYVLSPNNQPAPIGTPGEICIGGDGLARGYLNRSELTEEKFVENPLEPGKRMYRTGDIGRFWQDGNIEFLGRIDDQVKIRGFRVELEEIEIRLLAHDAVKEAVLVARDFQDAGNKEIAAYMTGNEPLNANILREWLKESLPDYMIPSCFIQMEEMPLNLNGKLDINALPDPAEAGMSTGREYMAPRDAVEIKLADIWRKVLHVSDIGILDNFFEIGGHSLRATRVISMIHKEMNAEISLRDFFTHSTIQEQAEKIRARAPSVFSPIAPAPDAAHHPLSHAQRRLWVLDKFEGGGAAYNVPAALALKGEPNPELLERVFEELIRRHESLRTVFISVAGEPAQKILDFTTLFSDRRIVTRLDLTGEPDPGKRARELAEEDAKRPFDLERGPLTRVTLLKLENGNSTMEIRYPGPGDSGGNQPVSKYVMLFNMHHIVSDGWSMTVLIREFRELYKYFNSRMSNSGSRRPHPLPPLRIQYKDYAAWQNRLLSEESASIHRDYWHETFSGEIPVLDLPLDFSRPAVRTFNGDAIDFSVSPGDSRRLKARGARWDASLFMTLLAVVKLLLHRYTGQEDIIVGAPIAGRRHVDLENQIGFYLNTLPLRDRVDGDRVFDDLLQRVKQTTMNAYDHQLHPFDSLVEELDLHRDLGRSPLFDVMVVLQNNEEEALSLEGLDIHSFDSGRHISKFDLTFTFWEDGDAVKGSIYFNTDLFRKDRIERMAAHFLELVKSILTHPEQPVGRLDILPERERRLLLYEFNDAVVGYPMEKSIMELFEEQVEKTPGETAVVFGEREITYRRLNREANRLARHLQVHGAGPETVVGIHLPRSPEMLIAVYSVFKAGAAWLPLDPNHPPERLTYMIEDARTPLVLSRGPLQGFTLPESVRIIDLEETRPLLSRLSGENPVATAPPGRLAYVLYTSGSTGKPKGVAVEHDQLLNYTLAVMDRLKPPTGASFAMVQPLTVDSCITTIFPPLLTGGPLHIISRENSLDPVFMEDYFTRYRIDCLKIAPSHLAALHAASPRPGRIMPRARLVVGGEASSMEWMRELLAMANGCRIFNHYGPTETTVGVLACRVDKEIDFENHVTVPVGRPLANTRAWLLDSHLRPTPIGVPGELYIGGDNVARGYMNRPELTGEAFIPDRFGGAPGKRLYKTGDLARFLPDGNIEFLGRMDDQVKISGFRIEPGEIESALLDHPAVRTALVTTGKEESGVAFLAAYIVLHRDQTVSKEEIRSFLKTKLPDPMLPSALVVLHEMPLTPHGKIDRNALPDPESARMERETDYEPPRDETEAAIAEAWAVVLGAKNIGVHDNYFALGGDSIKAIQVIYLLNQKELTLDMRDLFQYPVIRDLAPHVAPAQREKERETARGDVPLTSIQKWFFAESDSEPGHFNQSVMLRKNGGGRFHEAALRKALAALQDHHDALRLTYRLTDGDVIQRYADKPLPLHFEVLDLKEEKEAFSKMEKHADALQAGVDLERGPLMRTACHRLGDGDLLLIAIHHLVVDGVSWRILLEDLNIAYEQVVRNQSVVLPPRTASFKTWARKVHEYSREESLKREKDYWMQTTDAQSTPLPRDFKGDDNVMGNVETVALTLSEEETDQLLTSAHNAYTTRVDDLLLAALSRALQNWTGNRRSLIMMEEHGRQSVVSDVDVTRTVGWFTSPHPVLLAPPESDDSGLWIKTIKEILRKVPNRGVGWGILRWIAGDEGLARARMPEIGYNYMGRFDEWETAGRFAFASEPRGSEASPSRKRRHLIDVGGIVLGKRMTLSIRYDKTRFKETTILDFLADYRGILQNLIKHCVHKKASEKTPGDFIYSDFSVEDYQNIMEELT